MRIPDSSETRLQTYLSLHSIQAEMLLFEQSCHSVAEAALAVQASAVDFVKNICLIDTQGRLVVAIVKGEDRVSRERVAQALMVSRLPRLATPQEILTLSGYPCGGTPSFGFDAIFLVDPRVLESDVVYTGGGSETALLRISPQELLRANHARVVPLRK